MVHLLVVQLWYWQPPNRANERGMVRFEVFRGIRTPY